MRSPHRADLLAHLAEILGQTICEQGVDTTFGVLTDNEGVELYVRPAQRSEHVAEVLFGFDAPPEWSAIGVMATGRSTMLDQPPGQTRQAVVVVHLQARNGDSISLLGPPGGPLTASVSPGQGRIVDICRRCLGLATDPPIGSPLSWWVARWLDQLCAEPALELVMDERHLVSAFPGGKPFDTAADLASLERHARLLASSCPWSLIRSGVVSGALSAPGISARDAAWMDEGMFQRWAVGEVPSLLESLAELCPRLPEQMASALVSMIANLNLPLDRPLAGP
ncbi:MAG: hypothetical protein ACKV2O_01830 [Acidimicrobiales bacterium]